MLEIAFLPVVLVNAHNVISNLGLLLTGLGAAYYHHAPGRQTSIWDRLPMTIMFMGLFTAIIGEMLNPRVAHRLLISLLLLGVGSIPLMLVRHVRAGEAGRVYLDVLLLKEC